MEDRVLVPVDGSPQARNALDFALDEYPDSEIVVLHVINPLDSGVATDMSGMDYWEGWYDTAKEQGKEVLDRAVGTAEDRDRTVTTAEATGSPAREIVEFAEDNEIDHIVMGSHGRTGMERILLGSVAESVVRRASVPVTVVH